MLKIDNCLRKTRVFAMALILFTVYCFRGNAVQFDGTSFDDYDPTV